MSKHNRKHSRSRAAGSERASLGQGRSAGGVYAPLPAFEMMEPRLMLDGGPINITELMYHPSLGKPGETGFVAEDLAKEWVELHNASASPINLQGWRLNRGVDYAFGAVTIGADEYLVVAADVATFLAEHPGFSGQVVGGWTGHLSNSGEDVELENAAGTRIDIVSYADEGDWADRRAGEIDPTKTLTGYPSWFPGWEYVTAADGGGKTLELINEALSNNLGRNWAASTPDGGTPGAANSVAATDIAPIIVDLEHLPVIPSSSDPITVRAGAIDELGTSGVTLSLFWRVDGAPAFSEVVMRDDGLSGDGLAGDGVYAATLNPLADKTIVEFYVRATDLGGKSRTWPAPTDQFGFQGANALLQVDNGLAAAAQWTQGSDPIYRVIVPQAEYAWWKYQMDRGHPYDYSNAQMNATFVSLDGVDANVRYGVGVRNRGEGTRNDNPHNYRINFRTDDRWKGLQAVDFNTQYTQAQVAGMAIFQMAGLPAPNGSPVIMLTNGSNLAGAGSPQFGRYFRLEPYGSEFADAHFPLDSGGNAYKGVATSSPDADLRYINDNPDSYRMSYDKQTNESQDDWSDLINMLRTLNTTPDAQYLAAVESVIDLDEWLNYFAVDMLIGNRENSLGGIGTQNHWQGDDYSLYFGVNDPRALLLIHDMDTILGQGDYRPAADNLPEGLFPTSTIPALARLLKFPGVAQRYYQAYLHQMETTFAPENLDPLLDQVLGGWVSQSVIDAMKQYAVDRAAAIRALIPSDLTAASTLPVVSGYATTTEATADLTGTADAARTHSVLVNGVQVAYTPWTGAWSTAQALPGDTLVATGAVWKYLDDGSNQGTAWRSPDPLVFDDSAWVQGPSQLGYGEGDEATVVSYGPDSSNKYATTYFRHHFTVTDPSALHDLLVSVLRDDGIAVYLNGTEIMRNNLAAGAVYDSWASAEASDDGKTWISVAVDPALIVAGDNVLAVEVHQKSGDSSDVTFDLRFVGNSQPGTVALQPGINRVLVQALDESGAQIESTFIDVWRDTSAAVAVSGSLPAGTTIWSAANGPYQVTGNLTVPSGATLVIEPGTTVFFNSGTYMTVNGKLDARGTATSRIRFTVTPGQTNWSGLRFSGGAEANLISYADIEYSSGSDAIDASNTAIHIDNVRFGNIGAQYAIDLHTASILLTNSYIPHTGAHESMHSTGFQTNGYALIQGNYFGGTSGYNDVIDWTGGQSPGPIVRFIGNVFENGSDDVLDLDATDAYIAGNVFLNIHQDAARDSKSYCITTGSEGGLFSELTVVGNIFYSVDHALLSKDGGFITAINNTIVNVDKTHSAATTAVISFFEDRSGQWPGIGAILEGNIIVGAATLFENIDGLGTTTYLQFNNNIIPEGMVAPGTGNIAADARLVNTTNVTDVWKDFALRPGSPAIGAGPNGADAGALAGYLATVSGAPLGTTWRTGATLGVGGPDMYGYKYRVMKDGEWTGDWSAPVTVDWTLPKQTVTSIVRNGSTATATVPGHGYSEGDIIAIEGVSSSQREYNGPFAIFNVTANTFDYTVAGSPSTPASGTIRCWKPFALPAVAPITLSGLAAGTYTVYVVRQDSAGFWQDEAQATASGTWTVDPVYARLRINEVLAANVSAVTNAGLYPDVVELFYDADPASGPLSLAGYSLTDNASLPTKFTFAAGATINPGQHLILYADTATAAPGIHLGFSLKAGGDDLSLFRAGGTVLVDSIEWGVQLPDASIGVGPDGRWGLAQPTFGAANVMLRTGDPATLMINEWLTSQDVLFTQDWVELYNPDSLPVNMGGLYLSDNPALPNRFQVDALSFIAGDGLTVFIADDNEGAGADHLNFELSSYQGLLGIYDAGLDRIDQIYYMQQATDVSEGRTPNGGEAIRTFRLPTPGVANPGIVEIVNQVRVDLFEYNTAWLWQGNGTDLGTDWRAEVYAAESGWASGQGLLYIEGATLGQPKLTPLPGNPANSNRPYWTYYFRKHVQIDEIPDNATLEFTTYVDDAFVLYINGVEAFRWGIDQGVTVQYANTPTNRTVGDASLEGPFVISIPATALRVGDNVFAVEVKQNSSTSSDVVWGASMDLVATETTTIVTDDIPANIYNIFDYLKITEIMYNPVGGSDYEYVEFHNAGAEDLDLTGVRVSSGIDFTFGAFTLPAGGYCVIVNSTTAFRARYGTGPVIAGEFDGNLSNGGEELILQLPNPYDAAALRFDFSDAWYPVTDGGGPSLVILDPDAARGTWDERLAWRSSSVSGGSPGATDPAPAYPPGSVVINEVLAHTDGALGDWIELYNATGDPVNLGGWFLSDDAGDLGKFRIPDDTILNPGEYVVFTQAGDFGGAFGLSELGDQVFLSGPGGYLDFVDFGATARDVTLGRYQTSTGDVHFVSLAAPTYGSLNDAPLVGPVVISELMYHPPLDAGLGYDADEFIEIRNAGAAPVDLFDPANPENTWKFTKGVTFAFPAGTTLAAGEYALVVAIDPALFRSRYGIPAGVRIFGPYTGALDNSGETVELSMPGDPEPPTPEFPGGFVPYYVADRVEYNDAAPWPTTPDGDGPSLLRVADLVYGDDPVNWAAGIAGGTPGRGEGALPPPPVVTGVVFNELSYPGQGTSRPGLPVSGIEGSGIGVQYIDITFNEPVDFTAGDVLVQTVTFSGDLVNVTGTLSPVVTGGGTTAMRIELPIATVKNTWVQVVLADTITGWTSGVALDGEALGTGRGYVYGAADMPTGDGAAGGDARFFVGSLVGDLWGPSSRSPQPEGEITRWDITAFTAAYQSGSLNADLWGASSRSPTPEGLISRWDVTAFTAAYQSPGSLAPLPTLLGPLAGGEPVALVDEGESAGQGASLAPFSEPQALPAVALAFGHESLFEHGWASQPWHTAMAPVETTMNRGFTAARPTRGELESHGWVDASGDWADASPVARRRSLTVAARTRPANHPNANLQSAILNLQSQDVVDLLTVPALDISLEA